MLVCSQLEQAETDPLLELLARTQMLGAVLKVKSNLSSTQETLEATGSACSTL